MSTCTCTHKERYAMMEELHLHRTIRHNGQPGTIVAIWDDCIGIVKATDNGFDYVKVKPCELTPA